MKVHRARAWSEPEDMHVGTERPAKRFCGRAVCLKTGATVANHYNRTEYLALSEAARVLDEVGCTTGRHSFR